MPNIFVSKSKQKAVDIAKKAAQTVQHETREAANTASSQITGQEKITNAPSPVVEAMKQGNVEISQIDNQGIHRDENRRLTYLEDELRKLMDLEKLKKQQLEANERITQPSQGTEENSQKKLFVPSSPKKKGKLGLQRKQKKTEIGKVGSG